MVQQFNWRDRANELLGAVTDLGIPDHPPASQRGTPEHDALFQEYVGELTEAVESAEAWWRALVLVEEGRLGDRDEAEESVRERHPGGPSAHKFIIAAIRKAWLACSSTNERLPEPERVRPEELVLAWLVRRHPGLAEFISRLSYWPIGLDQEGRWV